MSNNINIKADLIKHAIDHAIENKHNLTQLKQIIPNTDNNKNENTNTLTVSKEGSTKANHYINTTINKLSGISECRQDWENFASERKKTRFGHFVGEVWQPNFYELMRIDEPETYEKWKELDSAANAFRNSNKTVNGMILQEEFNPEDEEYLNNRIAADKIADEWLYRRYINNADYMNSIDIKQSVLEKLEDLYSTDNHDTSFDISDDFTIDSKQLWRFGTKFNVILNSKMLSNLINGDDNERYQIVSLINNAINDIKNIEKTYAGDKELLRFGVIFDKNNKSSYHANYLNCEKENGIESKTAIELLERLTNTKPSIAEQ